MARSFHYVVKGKVQGVFFRQFAKDTAESLGIVGWVKNHRVIHISKSMPRLVAYLYVFRMEA